MLDTDRADRPFDDPDAPLRIDLNRTTGGDTHVIEVLSDEDCRAILAAADTPMTAGEIIDACEIPRATVYRKLKRLEAASLVRSADRIAEEGIPPTQYQRTVDRLLLRPATPREE